MFQKATVTHNFQTIPARTTFRKRCSVTGELYEITVEHAEFRRWLQGELVQKVFPMLRPEQREILMTGITPAEWSQLFPEVEE